MAEGRRTHAPLSVRRNGPRTSSSRLNSSRFAPTMLRGRVMSALSAPVRGLVMQSGRRVSRAAAFAPAQQIRFFAASPADLEKLSVLRKAVAEEFDVHIVGGGWPKDSPLDDNPNYDYVFEALKHDSEHTPDETCLYDTLATFAAIDKDRSGFLEKDELRQAMRELLKHDITDQELDNVFDKMDLNHDGKIDYFEFETGIKALTAQADNEEL